LRVLSFLSLSFELNVVFWGLDADFVGVAQVVVHVKKCVKWIFGGIQGVKTVPNSTF